MIALHFCRVVLALLLCFHLCHGDKNTSGRASADLTCDANKEQCNESVTVSSATSSDNPWEPFRYKSTKSWVLLDSLYPAYLKWHNKTLRDASIPCERKQVLVFTPNAGFGDSIGALTSAFHHVIKTGRLMFIDWKPFDWTVGMKPLEFHYDYESAAALRDPVTQQPLLCVKKSNDPASFLHGHVTSQHDIVNKPVINDYNFGGDKLTEILLQPSEKVNQIITKAFDSSKAESSGSPGDKSTSRLVGLVMRTGEGEYNQFLSKGDEINFVNCFRNYAKQVSKQSRKKINFRVFVTSDYAPVKEKVVQELLEEEDEDFSIEVVTLNDSIVHVMQVKTYDMEEEIVAKIQKTFAEFFLIGRCQVLFLTHGSLFGRAAAERGKVSESDVHYISDSNCDGKRDKYSYLQCHEPKYPAVCGFE